MNIRTIAATAAALATITAGGVIAATTGAVPAGASAVPVHRVGPGPLVAVTTPRGMCPTEDSCTPRYAHGRWTIVAVPYAPRRHATYLPGWLHVIRVSQRDGTARCVIVGGGTDDTTALVCADGTAHTS